MEDIKRISETEDGVTREVSVRKAENGYVTTINKWGNRKDSEGNDEYFDESKVYISKENPLDKKEADDGIESMSREDMFELLDNL
jgi:hypothetical protein